MVRRYRPVPTVSTLSLPVFPVWTGSLSVGSWMIPKTVLLTSHPRPVPGVVYRLDQEDGEWATGPPVRVVRVGFSFDHPRYYVTPLSFPRLNIDT